MVDNLTNLISFTVLHKSIVFFLRVFELNKCSYVVFHAYALKTINTSNSLPINEDQISTAPMLAHGDIKYIDYSRVSTKKKCLSKRVFSR